MLKSIRFCLHWSLDLFASPIWLVIDRNQVQVGTPYCFPYFKCSTYRQSSWSFILGEQLRPGKKKEEKTNVSLFSERWSIERKKINSIWIAFEWIGHLVLVSHSSYYYEIDWISWNWPYPVKEWLYTKVGYNNYYYL